jgi:hypothetical protein
VPRIAESLEDTRKLRPLVEVAAEGAEPRDIRLQGDADAHQFPARLVLEHPDVVQTMSAYDLNSTRYFAALSGVPQASYS